jgi:hypothetical protein
VAAKAAQIEAEARIELQEQKAKEAEEKNQQPQESAFSTGNGAFNAPSNFSPIGHNLNVMI